MLNIKNDVDRITGFPWVIPSFNGLKINNDTKINTFLDDFNSMLNNLFNKKIAIENDNKLMISHIFFALFHGKNVTAATNGIIVIG